MSSCYLSKRYDFTWKIKLLALSNNRPKKKILCTIKKSEL